MSLFTKKYLKTYSCHIYVQNVEAAINTTFIYCDDFVGQVIFFNNGILFFFLSIWLKILNFCEMHSKIDLQVIFENGKFFKNIYDSRSEYGRCAKAYYVIFILTIFL